MIKAVKLELTVKKGILKNLSKFLDENDKYIYRAMCIRQEVLISVDSNKKKKQEKKK